MPNTWQKAYGELKEFIAKNPQIEISANCIAIPGDVRPEFYRLFDAVRVEFLKDRFPASLTQGYEMSQGFARVYKAAMEATGLEAIHVRAAVNWFLQDPVNGLMRSLFDPLFNLIRGKISQKEFSETSIQIIEQEFTEYFRDGYRRWAILGLLALMKPDKNYNVVTHDYHTDPQLSEGALAAGLREEMVDTATEERKIIFDISLLSAFIVPRTLFHSTRLGRYASIHSDFTEAHWRAREKSPKMEWLTIKDIRDEFGPTKLWPDLLIYTADSVDDLNLVADHFSVARPDLIALLVYAGYWLLVLWGLSRATARVQKAA